MDLGLGNLDLVKKFVLPPATLEGGDTQYDAVLAAIAVGIAKRFESYCNRKFNRVVDDVVTFGANRSMYILPRYPIETISAVQLRPTKDDPWGDVSDIVVQQDEQAGLIYFGTFVADSLMLMKIIYTGGWWYETLEPTRADGTPTPGYPTAQPNGPYDPTSNPTGSFALTDPIYGAASLQGAWLMQTLHEFQAKDKLLPQGLKEGTTRHDLRFEQMQLLPEVQNALAQFRRFQIV